MASSAQTRRSRREQLEAQRRAAIAKDRRNKILLAAGAAVVVVLVVVIALWGWLGSQSPAVTGGTVVPPSANADKNGIALAAHVDGAPTLDIWMDYNCTACRAAELTLAGVFTEAASQGKVNIVIHPLSAVGATSGDAANAAACADVQGRFADYHNQLYIDQPTDGSGFTADMLRTTIPGQISLTGDALSKFQACVDNNDTGQFVAGIQTYAGKHNIVNSPTFLMDGKDVGAQIWNTTTGAFDADLLRTLLGLTA